MTPLLLAAAQAGGIYGINEGISVPLKKLKEGIEPSALEQMLRHDAQAIVGLGATMVRVHTATYPYLSVMGLKRRDWNWGDSDRLVRIAQDHNLALLVMLGPWPGNHTQDVTDTYVPSNLDGYATAISRIVERYDGDGYKDMPGLHIPVKHWEVDNEPDLHHTAPGSGGFQSAKDYAKVFIATADAIRKADSGATVLSGGIYRPHKSQGRRYLRQFLAIKGVMERVDVVSLHCYFEANNLENVGATLQTWRDLAPEKPLWITETSVPSDRRKPHATPEWQALMVSQIHQAFFDGGASAVFWHTLADPPTNVERKKPGGFSSNSLLQAQPDGSKADKPASIMYRSLTGAKN